MSRSGCLMSFPLGTPICLILFAPKPACHSLRLGLGGFVCSSLLGGDIGRNPGPVLRPRGTRDCRFCILRSPWLEVSLCVSFHDAVSSVLSACGCEGLWTDLGGETQKLPEKSKSQKVLFWQFGAKSRKAEKFRKVPKNTKSRKVAKNPKSRKVEKSRKVPKSAQKTRKVEKLRKTLKVEKSKNPEKFRKVPKKPEESKSGEKPDKSKSPEKFRKVAKNPKSRKVPKSAQKTRKVEKWRKTRKVEKSKNPEKFRKVPKILKS